MILYWVKHQTNYMQDIYLAAGFTGVLVGAILYELFAFRCFSAFLYLLPKAGVRRIRSVEE